MFSSGPNYPKLKTNLRLTISRLKLLEKKKMELAQKARKEIADYIAIGKVDRARIRVEHIIREDYSVEAMEMLEMYCDLILARFGIIQQMKTMDPGLQEAIASIVWAGPRLSADVAELRVICDQLTLKYGKELPAQCTEHANDKFKHRLSVQAPPKVLVENYLIEISKKFNVPFEPDAKVMKEAEVTNLLDFSDFNTNDLGGPGSGSGGGSGGSGGMVAPPGFRGYPGPPLLPSHAMAYPMGGPQPSGMVGNVGGFVAPGGAHGPMTPPPSASGYNIPVDDHIRKPMNYPMHFETPPPSYNHVVSPPEDANKEAESKPKPMPRGKLSPTTTGGKPQNNDILPELPSVPNDEPFLPDGPPAPTAPGPGTAGNNDEVDFDDLFTRFENLKRSK